MARREIDVDSIIRDQEEVESVSETASHLADPDTVHRTGREHVGTVKQFFGKIGVAAVKLIGSLDVGDIIEIGDDEDAIRQRIASMQIDNENVDSASAGDDVGIKLKHAVSVGSMVYKVG